MERLDKRAVTKISGVAWQAIRPGIEIIHNSLVQVDPSVCGLLTTIYVKYCSGISENPFSVVWLKSSKKVVVGFCLPESYEHWALTPPIPQHIYKGLTKYFVYEPGEDIPEDFAEFAKDAYAHAAR
jgi:hypothetical protein